MTNPAFDVTKTTVNEIQTNPGGGQVIVCSQNISRKQVMNNW
jgi:hypothetical protein